VRDSPRGVRCNAGGDSVEWWIRVNDGTDECGSGDVLGNQRTANLSNRSGGLCGCRNELSGSHGAELSGLSDVYV
jgi:hypothetical protein